MPEARKDTLLPAVAAQELRRADASLPRFYRWGWVPLVAGCVLIALGVFAGWELLLSGVALPVEDPIHRWLLLTRGLLAATLVAVWAGGYVLWTRARLAAARELLSIQAAELEEKARRAEAEAGLSALCRSLTHEIRAPLHSIALHAAKLRKLGQRSHEGLGGQLVHLADRVDADARALDELLSDYARYGQTSTAAFERAEVNLREVVAELVVELLPRAQAHGSRFEVTVPDGLPLIPGDRPRLRQAISILLRNALEAVAPGQAVQIVAGFERGSITFGVSNAGARQADVAELFRPFYAGGGTSGLGYSIVRDVLRAHGGEVVARERPEGGGTHIELRLPVEGP